MINQQLSQIIQDSPLPFAINVNQVFKDKNGVCWRYVGRFGSNYIPPANVSYSTQSGNYFVGAYECAFPNCSLCNSINLKPLCQSVVAISTNPNSSAYIPATQTSIPIITNVSPPYLANCTSLPALTVRRVYYSTVNNPPLLSDSYVDLPLVYGDITTFVGGLTPGTGYYFSSYSETNYGSCTLSYPNKIFTLN